MNPTELESQMHVCARECVQLPLDSNPLSDD